MTVSYARARVGWWVEVHSWPVVPVGSSVAYSARTWRTWRLTAWGARRSRLHTLAALERAGIVTRP